jgi:hypothetical protein
MPAAPPAEPAAQQSCQTSAVADFILVRRRSRHSLKHILPALVFTAALSVAADKKLVAVRTPSGEITFKEGTIPNQSRFDDTITELTAGEVVALERDSHRVPAFIAAFVLPKERTGDTLEDLDAAFAAWLKSGKRDAFTRTDVIRIVGCALGTR